MRRVKIPNGLDFDSAALWARRSGVREPVWHVVRPFFEVEVRRLQTIVHYPRADHGDGRYRRNRNHARHATPRVAVQHTRRHRVVIITISTWFSRCLAGRDLSGQQLPEVADPGDFRSRARWRIRACFMDSDCRRPVAIVSGATSLLPAAS